MNAVIVGLLVLTVLLLAVVFITLRSRGTGVGMLQEQLIEVRSRLDMLSAAQQALPKALAEGSAAQERSLAHVREQLGRLMEAATHLERVSNSVLEVQDLLRVPRLRGTLGEVWLEELLRQVFPPGIYHMQYVFKNGDKVDAVLRIGDRLVPIDAKFPLEACQRMVALQGVASRRERSAFRRSLQVRTDEIAKYIRPDEGTVDFAFMYVPAESIYYEAFVHGEELERQDSLVGYALARHVIPVSPHTFYAYLAAVLHGLRGLEIGERARDLMGSLGGLQGQLDRFSRTYELVGKHLEHAAKQYAESDRHLARVQERLEGLRDVKGPPGSATPPVLDDPVPRGSGDDVSLQGFFK